MKDSGSSELWFDLWRANLGRGHTYMTWDCSAACNSFDFPSWRATWAWACKAALSCDKRRQQSSEPSSVCVCVGSVSSLLQQAGRAGRREQSSASIYVAFDGPTDQYFFRNPKHLFGRPIEKAQVPPRSALQRALRCGCRIGTCSVFPTACGYQAVTWHSADWTLPGCCSQNATFGCGYESCRGARVRF